MTDRGQARSNTAWPAAGTVTTVAWESVEATLSAQALGVEVSYVPDKIRTGLLLVTVGPQEIEGVAGPVGNPVGNPVDIPLADA